MRKILISTCVILMISVTANACGGITIKGNSGATYCLSKHTMNWYSAYAWCDGQGMKLIDLNSVCKSSTSCPELNLSSDQKTHITNNGGIVGWTWTKTLVSRTFAYHVGFTGAVHSNGDGGYLNRSNNQSLALCF